MDLWRLWTYLCVRGWLSVNFQRIDNLPIRDEMPFCVVLLFKTCIKMWGLN